LPTVDEPGAAAVAGSTTRLGELARLFFRLGLTAFGGPAAHVALMRDELVRRRTWLTDSEFLDLLGAANLIPGPTSTELVLHLGHRRAGWAGFVVAGLTFISPAVVVVAVFAWAYVEFGARPEALALLTGLGPAVVAVVAHAALGLGRSAIRDPLTAAVAAGAVVAAVAGVPEIAVLLGAGVVALAARGVGAAAARHGAAGIAALGATGQGTGTAWPAGAAAAVCAAAAVGATPLALFAVFVKIGAILFGSGYLLVALLRAELVEDLGWITERQLLDAVAVGQLTPGPVSSTATFVGWLVGGPIGAAAATLGMFLPAFAAVALSIPILPRLRRSPAARAFLDGVNAAAVALIGLVAVQLGQAAIVNLPTAAIALGALFALATGRIGSAWVVVGGGAIGIVTLLLGG
jgi:chromate transporter